MCGIAGIVRLDGKAVSQEDLDRLIDCVAHRGPDGRGTFIKQNVGLAQRRLAIIDLSDAASQPMHSDDGTVTITFNGEIYNYQEKRRMLETKGHVFRSQSDTEVIIHLYQEYGQDCLSHLRGMFAFAIFDAKKGELFIARDRVGKKPLKYFLNNGVFAFSSELKALRSLKECPRGIDRQAIHDFLTMMVVPAPRTGFEGIHKLEAGRSMTFNIKTGAMDIKRYWALNYRSDDGPSVHEWKEKILHTFDESVRLRMIADVPVGAFLSGGIDSAAVVAFMSRHSTHPVKTFSIGTTQDSHNELPDAERIAKLFGTDHHPITVEPDIVSLLPELVRFYEEPYADPSAIPTYLISRETRSTVTVALNGDGGDENFAGYKQYPIARFSERWRRMPGFLHTLAHVGTQILHAHRDDTFSYRSKRFEDTINLPFPERYLQYRSFFTEEEKRAIERDDVSFACTDTMYAALTADARSRADDLVHTAMAMDVEFYLADDLLPKVDMGGMAHGLEARSPFLDHELMELCATIPSKYKLHGRQKKWILREALKGILPDETLNGKKRGFRLPLDHWFRTDAQGFVRDRLLGGNDVFWSFFDRAKMEQFLNSYYESRIDYSDHLWALLWLEEWTRQYT